MRLKKLFHGSRQARTERIGIYGMRRGAGATYLAVMLASYMNDIALKKTAVLQFDESRDLAVLAPSEAKPDFFRRYGVDFMVEAGRTLALHEEFSNEAYDCIIEDLGSSAQNMRRLAGCDRILLICTPSPWSTDDYKRAAILRRERPGGSHILINREVITLPEALRAERKHCKIVPAETDIFCLSMRSIKFFRKLMGGG